ncbi:MAG: hypothetical protein HC847_25040 [Hydrococcus sp. RU_2_2]|nr:hypothetical protein [Hydrococcus sp. RU_2_2]
MGIKNIENFYPLSPMQQGMLFHSLVAPQSGVYFEQFSYTFKGDFSIAAFDRAWQQVIKRHPVLRTCFAWEGLKEPVQIVHRQVKLPLIQKDWRHLSPSQQQEKLEVFLECDRDRDFQLTVPPLMRLMLIQLADNYYHFTWSFHHLLLDGWSVPLIFQEVFAFYQAFSKGQDISLASPRPYRDYIVWLQKQNLAEAEVFWRRMLNGFIAPTKLWRNQKREQTANDSYNCQKISLKASTTSALQSLSKNIN